MKIKAQMTMVLNLDKCLGCHTCSIPCKNVWTSRGGAEYMWFNNVETKPGIGYPKNWEDQGIYKGGWTARDGRLAPMAGGRVQKLSRIFNNPDLPQIDAYYEPWDYDYGRLITSPVKKHQPAIYVLQLLELNLEAVVFFVIEARYNIVVRHGIPSSCRPAGM